MYLTNGNRSWETQVDGSRFVSAKNCDLYCVPHFSSPARYSSMAIEASVLSAWCQQCWFWLLKSLLVPPLFSLSSSFSLSLHLPCLLCGVIFFYVIIWFAPGWFLLRLKGNMRSSNWYFIFSSLHVLYILSCFYFKLFFLYFNDMSEIFVHFLLSCI